MSTVVPPLFPPDNDLVPPCSPVLLDGAFNKKNPLERVLSLFTPYCTNAGTGEHGGTGEHPRIDAEWREWDRVFADPMFADRVPISQWTDEQLRIAGAGVIAPRGDDAPAPAQVEPAVVNNENPPCCECGAPVAHVLDLVHVGCEFSARADALHALLEGLPKTAA